jgi:hypothetical protein
MKARIKICQSRNCLATYEVYDIDGKLIGYTNVENLLSYDLDFNMYCPMKVLDIVHEP